MTHPLSGQYPSLARLRKSDCSGPGITRRKRGKGFEYLNEDGDRVADDEILERIRELAIPPAWTDAWICPHPMGHLQATGVDAAGRKQYLYHPRWRERRDQEKFDEMIDFARSLPKMRKRVTRHLSREDMGRERALACAVRLLDVGFFRVGGEDYAADNESYGLATMKKGHVTCVDGWVRFDYPAKSGQRHVKQLVDDDVFEVVRELKRRRGGSDELLAYKDGRRWRDVRSADINAYIKEVTGAGFSAKDFRTWNATVLAAVALSVAPVARRSQTATKRAINWAVKQVAHYLGNTPAVARASYIDPRIFDRFRAGYTISGALPDVMEEELATMLHGPAEEAVLDLLERDVASDAIEKTREFEKLAA